MASEVIKLNLIPSGEMPTYHCSQFDNGRLILIDLFNGEDEYSLPAGYTAELHTRKMDNNIVTLATTSVSSNHLTFTSTEQLTACAGNNLSEVSIKDASDYVVGTINFWLYVEKDPLAGGLTSTSAIHDLTDQIEEITTEIVGENYYNKTETDDLLDLKADKSTTYTKTEVNTLLNSKADASSVYTKSETNTLLSAKADADDVYTKSQVETKLSAKADTDSVYTKSETDTLLSAKADANGVYSKVEVDAMVDDLEDAIDLKADAATTYTKTEVNTALALKANAADVYTKEQTYSQAQVDALIDNIFPTLSASGAIATFTTALTKPLVSVTADAGATTITRCGVNLFDVSNINDTHGSNTLSISGNEITITWVNGATIFNTKNKQIFKAGTYVIKGFGTNTNKVRCFFYKASDNTSLGNVFLNAGTAKTLSEPFYIEIGGQYDEPDTAVFTLQLELGSTATAYHPYTGNTVPVSDATTLVTESGVNNVFADSGDVTVQYKYMSM